MKKPLQVTLCWFFAGAVVTTVAKLTSFHLYTPQQDKPQNSELDAPEENGAVRKERIFSINNQAQQLRIVAKNNTMNVTMNAEMKHRTKDTTLPKTKGNEDVAKNENGAKKENGPNITKHSWKDGSSKIKGAREETKMKELLKMEKQAKKDAPPPRIEAMNENERKKLLRWNDSTPIIQGWEGTIKKDGPKMAKHTKKDAAALGVGEDNKVKKLVLDGVIHNWNLSNPKIKGLEEATNKKDDSKLAKQTKKRVFSPTDRVDESVETTNKNRMREVAIQPWENATNSSKGLEDTVNKQRFDAIENTTWMKKTAATRRKLPLQRPAIVYLGNEAHFGERGRDSCLSVIESLKSLSRHFPLATANSTIQNPIVIFLHDDELKTSTKSALRKASPFPVYFHSVVLDQPRDKKWASVQEIDYKRMCAFWFHDFFELNFLPDYVMRMDTDSCIASDMVVNPFQYMYDNNMTYMYHSYIIEPADVIEGLKDFAVKNPGITEGNPTDLWRFGDGQEDLMEVASTNLEWFHMPSFKKQKQLQWKAKVLENGGIFRHRWGDAPLRTLLVSMFFDRHEVTRFCPFEYNHSDWMTEPACTGTVDQTVISYGWNIVHRDEETGLPVLPLVSVKTSL